MSSDSNDRRSSRAPLAIGALVLGGAAVAIALLSGGDKSETPRREPLPPAEPFSRPASVPDEPAHAESSKAASARSDARAFTEIFVTKTGDEQGSATDPAVARALGGGRTAALRGRVTDEKGLPIQNATVRFLAGLNAGETFATAYTDVDGRYEMPSLYHGAAILEIESPRKQRARRDLVLRKNAVTIFDLPFLAVGDVAGSLIDTEGKPVVGARVEIDGSVVETDRDGAFFHSVVTPGTVIAYVSAKGFESRRFTMSLRPAQHLVFDQVRLPLRRGETLTVAVEPLPPATRPWTALLLPNDPPMERAFPYELLAVAQPSPDVARFEGLPVGEPMQVRVFSEFGVCDPGSRPVQLKAGDTNLSNASFTLMWRSPVSGVVTLGGQPLPNAPVRLESLDVAESTETVLRGIGGLDRVPVPILECVRKSSITGPDGRFRIESSDVQRPAALVVDSPRYRRVVKPLPAGTADFGTIELQPRADDASAKLALEFARPANRQVRVTLERKPRADQPVDDGGRLELADLPPGFYTVVVREDGKETFKQEGLLVRGETKVTIP